ncbi:hypothetical protein CMI42_01810 [Candidatus Pacearchaeota archaeon]|nr:hypothetical protein [Candidatus Pacearchaeota archaeon]|tara:strand:- start:331 stop:768 length:438 start_codon:yes stop_codon:yes gene_type:complete
MNEERKNAEIRAGKVNRWEDLGFQMGNEFANVYQLISPDGEVAYECENVSSIHRDIGTDRYSDRNRETDRLFGFGLARELGKLAKSDRAINTYDLESETDCLKRSNYCRQGKCEPLSEEAMEVFRSEFLDNMRRYEGYLEFREVR